ncbi:hypothetical protein RRG08_048380 [Elysia crispata]|uniref:Uncharacterized protein n=1 Tax=Elysia crispata TaxID=231223 RepID=A0AAE1EDA4_9GAST|nr:hypothetical protein RRG08_048380 [Elysia crispata]
MNFCGYNRNKHPPSSPMKFGSLFICSLALVKSTSVLSLETKKFKIYIWAKDFHSHSYCPNKIKPKPKERNLVAAPLTRSELVNAALDFHFKPELNTLKLFMVATAGQEGGPQ